MLDGVLLYIRVKMKMIQRLRFFRWGQHAFKDLCWF